MRLLRNIRPRQQDFENKEQIILRDHLALERTKLANERTYMSYVRTALYMMLAGIAFLQIQGLSHIEWGGYILMPLSGIIVIVGTIRFVSLRIHIQKYYKKFDDMPKP